MIVIIDNYDSFTYNLYQLVGEILNDPKNNFNKSKSKIKVIKNDQLDLNQFKELHKKEGINHIIISPGPGNPANFKDFGVCKGVIKSFANKIPILGVCLGHQGIFYTYGGKIIRQEPVHGKQSLIIHDNNKIFQGIKNPLLVARYHSLAGDPKTIPECIHITAITKDGIIMALEHFKYPLYGVQFHPESMGTKEGKKLLENFLKVQA